MKAVRIQESSGVPYSDSNPAPSAAIQLKDVPIPQIALPGQLVVQIKATTVIRDNLSWPGLHDEPPVLLGNDFAGVVTDVHPTEQEFRPDDAVYGMVHGDRGGTWAEYALVTSEEAYHKPESLSWAEAAALPLSAMTADQALFRYAQLPNPAQDPKRILVTGASGGVGMLVIAFAAAAGYHPIAATSSNARNETFLRSLGAKECIEYDALALQDNFDVIIDTVGSDTLRACWKAIEKHGSLISVDTASWNFAEEHRSQGISEGKEGVQALFFVVEPSKQSMQRISDAVNTIGIKGLVAKTMSLAQAREAYDLSYSRKLGRGKIVLTT